MARTRGTSAGAARQSLSSFRLRLLVLVVKIWRAWERPRTTLPLAVNRKRLAAPRCVFSLDNSFLLTCYLPVFPYQLCRGVRLLISGGLACFSLLLGRQDRCQEPAFH